MSVISVEQLKFKYQNAKKNAVDGVSFCIEKGAYTAIVGSNGSGKSTLARLLCGLETPLEGSIQVQENQNIGIVFQKYLFHLKVGYRSIPLEITAGL